MELLQNRVPNHQSSPIEGSRPPPYAALLHVKERNFDAIKEGPVSVDHINRLAIPAVTPTSMLVNLILGRHRTATRLGPLWNGTWCGTMLGTILGLEDVTSLGPQLGNSFGPMRNKSRGTALGQRLCGLLGVAPGTSLGLPDGKSLGRLRGTVLGTILDI